MFNWKVLYAPNALCKNQEFKTADEIENSGYDIISAKVPGNIEIDLMNAGKLDDVYYSTNPLKTQELENLHLWYYTTVNISDTDVFLRFEGIDTISDIYVNGKLIKSTDNMFINYDVYPDFKVGTNEIVVHIKPTCIETRKLKIPASSHSLLCNSGSLYVRKAAHMYGWDIMPRIVSAGIWREVKLLKIKQNKINEVYIVTNKIDLENKKANMRIFVDIDADGDYIQDYSYSVEGICKDKKFYIKNQLWHTQQQAIFDIEDCLFWWPKGKGEPNLYKTKITLYYKGEIVDTYELNVGVRTLELEYTDVSHRTEMGEFLFKINGEKLFVLGTNWTALDALHSNDLDRLDKAIELVEDIGCNMIRSWGGGVYESNRFFDLCDQKGILVWQDFMMACGVYPQEEKFAKILEEEAVIQIKRLRNHPSLAIWAGDNECDFAYMTSLQVLRDPNKNILTRKVLPQAVETYDYSRPYLPSSPYVSKMAYNMGIQLDGSGEYVLPENHLWGPRDYFKGNYYKNAFANFISEMGYHGFPSVKSLEKFLEKPEIIFKEDNSPTDEYLVHAASAVLGKTASYAYRIRLAYKQVQTLFSKVSENIEDFSKQSQISQAEAMKYFIERCRINKWNQTGIIWWNILDGWPQVSDAVVDYYYTKKLAYHYIKRSQQPICLMFDEPNNNKINLIGVNDLKEDVKVSYKVVDVYEDKELLSGTAEILKEEKSNLGHIEISDEQKTFYLIEWEIDGKKYFNHYFTNVIDIDYDKYMTALKKCKMDEFEGF